MTWIVWLALASNPAKVDAAVTPYALPAFRRVRVEAGRLTGNADGESWSLIGRDNNLYTVPDDVADAVHDLDDADWEAVVIEGVVLDRGWMTEEEVTEDENGDEIVVARTRWKLWVVRDAKVVCPVFRRVRK